MQRMTKQDQMCFLEGFSDNCVERIQKISMHEQDKINIFNSPQFFNKLLYVQAMYLGTEGRMVIYTAWPHLPAGLQAQILGQKWYWSRVEAKVKLLKHMEFKVAVLVSDCMKLEMQWEKARMTPRSLTWRLVHGCCIHQRLVYGRKNMVFVICASY